MRTALVDHPLDPAALLAEVADVSSGASTLFVGTVRRTNQGRPVTGIDYSAYEPMALSEMTARRSEHHHRCLARTTRRGTRCAALRD
jgi:molybdopterin synthase catalytic subunit